MRLTMRTNLALRTLMFCAVNEGSRVRKSEIAAKCNASANHLGLVINQLGQRGFLQTVRGRFGGIQLARPANSISIGEVMRDFEACLPFTECFEDDADECPIKAGCRLRDCFSEALEAFYASLDRVTVADLTDDNAKIREILKLEAA